MAYWTLKCNFCNFQNQPFMTLILLSNDPPHGIDANFTPNPHLLFSSKGVELLVCDLLLTLRTSVWQRGGSSNGEPGPAPGSQLAGFQRDLSALRKLTQCYRQAQHKVHPPVGSDTVNGIDGLWGPGCFTDTAVWPAAGRCFESLRSRDSRCFIKSHTPSQKKLKSGIFLTWGAFYFICWIS